MVWIKLFWWMVWRGVVTGAASGAVFGTIVALFLGTFFGLIFGAILGLATGILNGLAVAIITRFWFYPPQNSPHYRKAMITTVVICTALTSLIVMNSLWFGVTILIILPTIIATVVFGLMARRFPAYVESEFWEREHAETLPTRKAQIVW